MKETVTTAYSSDEESETKIGDSDKIVKVSKTEFPTEKSELDVSRYKKTEVRKRVVAYVSTED